MVAELPDEPRAVSMPVTVEYANQKRDGCASVRVESVVELPWKDMVWVYRLKGERCEMQLQPEGLEKSAKGASAGQVMRMRLMEIATLEGEDAEEGYQRRMALWNGRLLERLNAMKQPKF